MKIVSYENSNGVSLHCLLRQISKTPIMNKIEFLSQPWPWYVAGPLIGLMVPLLLLFDDKQFGISSTLRDFCAAVIPRAGEYFRYSLREHQWRNFYILGIFFGGILAAMFLRNDAEIAISSATKDSLTALGITDFSGLAPAQIFAADKIFTLNGIVFMMLGGFAIGFGTRYADGCTSGHAITGLSLLSLGSLIAVLGFFAGGLISTHILFPLIF